METPTSAPSPLERVLRRDRAVVAAALAGVVALAWAWLLAHGTGGMDGPVRGMAPDMAMTMPMSWDATTVALTAVMWAVMMTGMMLPGAAPMILLFATVQRRAGRTGYRSVVLFVLSYVVVWGGFSVAAALLQWGLAEAALLAPGTEAVGRGLGGALVVAAGIYQITPLKRMCLTQCRAPFQFIATRWRPGAAGALRMGLEHGVYCLGCCWILMGLLFAVGVMNLLWVAVIAAFVLLEKAVPHGDRVGQVAGVGLVAMGAWMMAGA